MSINTSLSRVNKYNITYTYEFIKLYFLKDEILKF